MGWSAVLVLCFVFGLIVLGELFSWLFGIWDLLLEVGGFQACLVRLCCGLVAWVVAWWVVVSVDC